MLKRHVLKINTFSNIGNFSIDIFYLSVCMFSGYEEGQYEELFSGYEEGQYEEEVSKDFMKSAESYLYILRHIVDFIIRLQHIGNVTAFIQL